VAPVKKRAGTRERRPATPASAQHVMALWAAAVYAAASAASTLNPVMAQTCPNVTVGAHIASSSEGIPFTHNPDPDCWNMQDKDCPYTDTVTDCCAGCRAHPNCSAFNWFSGSQNTGPNHTRTKHSCELLGDGAVTITNDGHYTSSMLSPLPVANAWPGGGDGGPPKGCLGNFSKLSFCDKSLPAARRAALLSAMLTPKELADAMNDEMPPIARMGISSYRYGHEGLHGLVEPCTVPGAWLGGGKCFTNFPTSSAVVASFNRSLWYLIGKAEADEARGAYNSGYGSSFDSQSHQGFGLHIRGPQLNPQRDPRWGRNQNSPGECAYTQGEYGVQITLGAQGALPNGTYPFDTADGRTYRKVLREMKHFTAYSVEGGRNSASDTWNISLRDLDEYYFVPLKSCVQQANIAAFMCSYSSINGTAACGNRWLNNDVVRQQWNWSGVIETDCGGMNNPLECGSETADAACDHAVQAIKATVDMECQGSFSTLPNATNYSSSTGVTLDMMREAVARTFTGRFQVGEFDPNVTVPYGDLTNDTVFSPAHQALSLEAAEQSIVMLRNAPKGSAAHLPLKRGLKLALIGPNGNHSDVYQGQYHGMSCPEEPSNSEDYTCLPSTVDAITAANTGGSVTFVAGCPWKLDMRTACPKLTDQAAVKVAIDGADVVVLILGEDIMVTNSEGVDRKGYPLAGAQTELAQAVAEARKPTIVVMLTGGAVGMDWIAAQLDWPILVPGYSGIFGPEAVARTLFGDVAPAGLLPYTIYPESWADCQQQRNAPLNTSCNNLNDMSLLDGDGRTYKWYGYKNQQLKATFPFGSGEYFTQFELAVEPSVQPASRQLVGPGRKPVATYHVTYKNVGQTASRCRLIMFARPVAIDQAAPSPLPIKQILTFSGSPVLAPGGSATEEISLHLDNLAMTNNLGRRATYSGRYEIIFHIGGNATTAPAATAQLTVQQTTVLNQLPPPYGMFPQTH
jgi:beta-D-xylosidase 4